jgi:hypothetical protein
VAERSTIRETVFHKIKLEIQPVLKDAHDAAAAELVGFWFVVSEVDGAGDTTGEVFRFPAEPAVANLLAESLLSALAGAFREPGAPLELEPAEKPAPSGSSSGGIAATDEVGNRRHRRRRRFGNGLEAQGHDPRAS